MIDVLLDMPAETSRENEVSDVVQATDANSAKPIGQNRRNQVFISYSHKDDEMFINALLTHLKPYTRNGSVTHWSDKQIAPGSKWMSEIHEA